jgi:hypothetical protein
LSEAIVNFGKARDLSVDHQDKEREAKALEFMMKTNISMAEKVVSCT